MASIYKNWKGKLHAKDLIAMAKTELFGLSQSDVSRLLELAKRSKLTRESNGKTSDVVIALPTGQGGEKVA